jgi:superfamily II DNA or RNA helicase
MDFKKLTIENEYRTLKDSVVKKFYIPVLKCSVNYRRAVGFFSSQSLVDISKGICGLINNNGDIKLIASPRLNEEDIQAIRSGYENRKAIIKSSLINALTDFQNNMEQDRLNLLASLIAQNKFDIKIALLKSLSKIGMYHEKMGIFEDANKNLIAFSGSMNETNAGLFLNYETIDVFRSWTGKDEANRVQNKAKAFDLIWKGLDPRVEILNFPEIKDEILNKYKTKNVNLDIDEEEYGQNHDQSLSDPLLTEKTNKSLVRVPENLKYYQYQNDAIETWTQKGYTGIFDMATGTGKTLTGIGALVKLYDYLSGKLASVIVCPYQHLVEQWVEDLIEFNITPIIAYSTSNQKDWKDRLTKAIRNQKLKIKKFDFFCLVTTNATFSSEFVQKQLNKIKSNALLVVDEAHNFGACKLQRTLTSTFNYRLALSATLDRHNDPEGTKALYDYFGEKCIEYTLERAIDENKLTPYKYFPVLVYLSEHELKKYTKLSDEIAKCVINHTNGNISLNEKGKKLALKRARLVAGAESKLKALVEQIEPYDKDNHILIYCGAANVLQTDKDESDLEFDDIRQIDAVTTILNKKLKMNVSQFTSKEGIVERKILKKKFTEGDKLKALIAIKCLDEGVNIPCIKVAFILASTTNPKEYIQRRGRVLRLYPGKSHSEIFDFVTLPRPLNCVSALTEFNMKKDLTLVKNELNRLIEFSKISQNPMYSDKIIQDIKNAYGLSENEFKFSFV